ncbi:variable surface protein, partial [Plasmodium gonderi]
MNYCTNVYIMVTSETKTHTFDFSNIFPQCTKDFRWINFTPNDHVAHKLTNLCSDFNLNHRNSENSAEFSQRCQLVTYYLEHIRKNKEKINVEPCCKYFFYKLKGLFNAYRSYCGSTKLCYEKMQRLSSDMEFKDVISPLFSLCDSNISDAVEEIFPIFEKIDYTYDNLSLLLSDKRNPSDSKFKNFKSGVNDLERIHHKYNDSFKELLILFNKYYLDYVNGLNPDDRSLYAFLSYRRKAGDMTGVLRVIGKKPQTHAITG